MTAPLSPTLSLEAETDRILSDLRTAIAAGEDHWLLALLAAIREWPLAEERVGERTYRYLIGGEAFDWLLLAERLCDEIEDLIPEEGREALLFHGRLPLEMDEDELNRLLGAKQRAHLNFVYGVRVEHALQLAVQAEVEKERTASRIWENGHVDEEVFQRIYGATRPELVADWRAACHSERPAQSSADGRHFAKEPGGKRRGPTSGRSSSSPNGRQNDQAQAATPRPETLSLTDLSEFTYWLFKRRLNNADPARVASDTRKGLAMLVQMEARRRNGPTPQRRSQQG